MAERADIIHVELLRDFVAALGHLREEAPLLLGGVIQLRKAVGHFHPRDVNLKSLRHRRVVRLLLRERRDVGRKFVKDRGLDKLVFR